MGKIRTIRWLALLLLLFLGVGILGYWAYPRVVAAHYDIIIYGGGFAGCASARSAASLAPDKKVLLIVPDPVPALGGLGTIGGQNFADIRYWQERLVTRGSFAFWFDQSGQFYNTGEMAEILRRDLARFPNLEILYQHDLKGVLTWKKAVRVLSLAPIKRDGDGTVAWQKGWRAVWGKVFIDASDEGRLVRLAGNQVTVGRQDWPAEHLEAFNEGRPASKAQDPAGSVPSSWARQQAATLMFKVKGVKTPVQPGQYGDFYFALDFKGSWGLVGGQGIWQNDGTVRNFNESFRAKGFAIKPINAAQNGAGSAEWWVNMLLVFDVDGRASEKDRGSSRFPVLGEGQKTVDQAWQEARALLERPEFLQALRRFTVAVDGEEYGFGEADLVRDQENKPVVGQVMYLRETVHGLCRGEAGGVFVDDGAAGKAEKYFALTTEEAQKAGAGSGFGAEQKIVWGADRDNFTDRIGLGYYMMDINAYRPEDLQHKGQYVWPVTGYLRPDWLAAGGQPVNPVYLPYAMLLPSDSVNLLVPGYATSCTSLAWSEIRVLPNLTVLGDAAGTAAARAVLFGENPADFGPAQWQWMQEQLRKNGACLDK
jgi:hypothetical protein